MKKCVRCGKKKGVEDFCRNKASRDGRQSWCKDCMRDYMRERSSNPVARRQNAKASAKRYPERRSAREKVKDAIRAGRIPKAKDLECYDCGKPADQYDHYEGYEHPLSVQAVCYECHGLRDRKRGEHLNTVRRELDGKTWDEYPMR